MTRPSSAVRASALLAAAVLLGISQVGGCFGSGGDTPPPALFSVLSTAPADGASGVPISGTVSVTFDRDADPATITSATFAVAAVGPVAGTIVYTAATFTAVFTPAAPLAGTTLHTVTLSGDIRSSDGRALVPRTFTFTTGAVPDTTPPSFSGAAAASPENALRILVTWTAASDAVDPASSLIYRVYRAGSSGGQDFAAPVATTPPGATSFADTGLTPLTTYFYVVRAVDSSGNEDANAVERSAATPARRSWSGDVWTPLINPRCSGCHPPNGGLSLTPIGTAYAQLVGVAGATCAGWVRVVPGDGAASFFFRKLSDPAPACGNRMPLGGPFFSAGELDTVRDWIDEGALNN